MLATRVSHTRASLLALLGSTVQSYVERSPGVLEVRVTEGAALLVAAAGRALSSVEAAEVRALVDRKSVV